MLSPISLRALDDANAARCALLKFISPNDVGLTGSHQSGYYLPKRAWNIYSPHPPTRGGNKEHPVRITWQDGRITESTVKWYGTGTRSEYRLTKFGRDFPWLTPDNVGNLLILIPHSYAEFTAYILDLEDDITEIQAALGVQVFQWAIYPNDAIAPGTKDQCLNRHFRKFVEALKDLPKVDCFSKATLNALMDCSKDFKRLNPDNKLLTLVKEEYALFRMAERKIFQPDVQRLFKSIDDFLQTALSILNARKARAGRSLENHVAYILTQAKIPFATRPTVDNTRPDILIPDAQSYNDPQFPIDKLFIVGIKRTCKDRWRQVTKEAPRVQKKHILTLQEGISAAQLKEMRQAEVTLVVPKSIHKKYPPSPVQILDIGGFLSLVRKKFPR